jgi:hypothetical protein
MSFDRYAFSPSLHHPQGAVRLKAFEGRVGQLVRVQVLGCRLGRCFCAMHRGVHRTPAPRLSHQEKSIAFAMLFSMKFALRRVKLLRSEIRYRV